MSFHPSSIGRKVFSSTVGRWLKACISNAYELKAKSLPGKVLPHSIRSTATVAAWVTQASVEDICRAASWLLLSSFVRHYKLDTYASAEASFGRRVLQSVISTHGQGVSQAPDQCP